MVVRLDAGRDAVRAYVQEHASRGLRHVRSLIADDNNKLFTLIGDLSEEESRAVTSANEWSVFETLRHLSASLDRGKTRLEVLSSGQPYVSPPMTAGQMGDVEYASFDELRRACEAVIAAIDVVLERADPARGLELTAEHIAFGPFNWLEWAVYSHHVHIHDHIGQIEAICGQLRA